MLNKLEVNLDHEENDIIYLHTRECI